MICPYGQVKSSDGLSCIDEVKQVEPELQCSERQRKVVWPGTESICMDCPSYQRAQDGGTTCRADSCSSRQIVNIDGTCESC